MKTTTTGTKENEDEITLSELVRRQSGKRAFTKIRNAPTSYTKRMNSMYVDD